MAMNEKFDWENRLKFIALHLWTELITNQHGFTQSYAAK
jgi:hypothetical protein